MHAQPVNRRAHAAALRPKGPTCASPGQRPGKSAAQRAHSPERAKRYATQQFIAPRWGLGTIRVAPKPRPLAWAGTGCPFGAMHSAERLTPKARHTAKPRVRGAAAHPGLQRITSIVTPIGVTQNDGPVLCNAFGVNGRAMYHDPGCAGGPATLGCAIQPLRGKAARAIVTSPLSEFGLLPPLRQSERISIDLREAAPRRRSRKRPKIRIGPIVQRQPCVRPNAYT